MTLERRYPPSGGDSATTHADLPDTDTDGHPIAAVPGLQTALDAKAALDAGNVAAQAAAWRTALGLVIGTNVQAHDTDLDSIGGLATTTFGRERLTDADAAAARTALGVTHEIIAETVLGAPAASIAFSSIPQTYTHLRLIGYARTTVAATNEYIDLRFNGDTGSNYDWHRLNQTPSVITATESFAAALAQIGRVAGSTAPSDVFDMFTIDVPNYRRTTGQKVGNARSAVMSARSAGNSIGALHDFWWRSTAAITSITLFPDASGSFAAGSVVSLYGIKGA